MDRTHAAKLVANAHWIKAFAEGANLQRGVPGHHWSDDTTFSFDSLPGHYRIKPTARPFDVATLPLNAFFRGKGGADNPIVTSVRCAFRRGVRLNDNSESGFQIDYDTLRAQFDHTLDGGVTWKPCEVAA